MFTATFLLATPSCLFIPIPLMEDSVVFGRQFTDEEVQSMVSNFKNPQEVKAKLGEPIVDFGPQRVFVYKWTVKKGNVLVITLADSFLD